MFNKVTMVSPGDALAGRNEPIEISRDHLVLGHALHGPFPLGTEVAYFALGCFWGAERKFYQTPGVYVTAVGYQGGYTPNPTYREVCTGRTGHAEAVQVVFDPTVTSYEQLVRVFFESHDPTQGFRQGNDSGTQYRSAIYTTSDTQRQIATDMARDYNERLHAAGYGDVTTEIAPAGPFYYAEVEHQQYLEANPRGYCGLGGTGVSCPVGLATN